MDRTIIVPYRAEEKELSHILYNTIQGLILLFPPTEDLRKCLSDDMFIKPNQQAFFHIMHYLFRIFDAQEFKKRFFWPITDKRSESIFRTSTVEYLKHINDKYQLNWTNIKSYLVVMPGGMKFISFLLDFVKFIVQELVKQKEKQLNVDVVNYRSQISEANIHKMCAKNEIFKAMVSEFIDTVDNLNAKYEAKSSKLMHHLETLSQETGLSLDLITDDKFLKEFEEYNYQLFDTIYIERTRKVLEMDNLISELKDAMDKFYSKETSYKYDKEHICQQLQWLRDNFHIHDLVEKESKLRDDSVNINTLISAFTAINDTIQNELKSSNRIPCVGEVVNSRLLSLRNELQDMETQITNFQKMLVENIKKSRVDLSQTSVSETKTIENALISKLVYTPPIKFEVPESRVKSRLALVGSRPVKTNETTFNNFLAPSRALTMRQPNRNHSLMDQTISDLNNTINRSKIIDPMQLLRSTSKKDSSKYRTTATQQNISNLDTKQHQSISTDADEEEPTLAAAITPKTHLKPSDLNKTSTQSFTIALPSPILQQSPFTPFSSNDRTRIARLDFSAISDGNNLSSQSSYAKKISAVKKVQDASLNFANLSTSPSGRLEPLIASDDFNMPKLKLNDISLVDRSISSNKSMDCKIPKLLINSPSDENISKFENVNKREKGAANIYDEEEDALFNISDSVLKDVIL